MKASVRSALMRSIRDGSAVLIVVILTLIVLITAGVDIVPWD